MTRWTTEHPGWLEIRIEADPAVHDALSAFLFDLGCTGVVTETFQDHGVSAYLPGHNSPDDIRSRIEIFLRDLKDIFPDLQCPQLSLTRIDNQDWNANWRRFFHTDRITPNLTIVPAWEPVPESVVHHVIQIDPGPAFGTGRHPTTRMCLEALEKLDVPETWSMLDVGTGSGILAIYAAVLRAQPIMAVDTDPEALRWAGRNIDLNGMAEKIGLSDIPLERLDTRYTVLTANMILGEILELFPHFPRLLDAGGWLILSGILRDQVDAVKTVLHAYRFHDPKSLYQEEWACVVSRKDHGA